MKQLAKFIVTFRKFILAFFVLISVLAGIGTTLSSVEYDITQYLPEGTDTKIALRIMDDEFVTYGTSTILVRNISYNEASSIAEEIRNLEGVKSLPFENTEDYYSSSSALFSITFDGTDEDEICVNAYNNVVEKLSNYDIAVAAKLVDDYSDQLAKDISFILVIVVAIIVVVLIFTSQSFAEVVVYLIVFAVSALLNMGTNFMLGKISFVSNSVCVILQLALAIDYAIIMAQRFSEEKQKNSNVFEAMIESLSKAIPEIFGSSLTTIGGLLSLCFMTFQLGADLGICLAKSIVCSLITVFFLMPCLLLAMSKAIDKTTHQSFVPKISFFGKSILTVKHVLPVVFLGLCVVGCVLTTGLKYCYDSDSIDTSKPTSQMVAQNQISEIFGSKNQFVVLVPKGDYELEKQVVNVLKQEDLISEVTAISDVEIVNNNITLTLTEKINYKDFASFIGVDETVADEIFTAYTAVISENSFHELAVYEANKDIYTTSLLDMIDTAIDNSDFIEAYFNDDEDTLDSYLDVKEQITDAEDQLVGNHYTRIVFNILADVEDEKTFDLITRLNKSVKSISPNSVFAGNSMNAYDLSNSFVTDNVMISILTIIFVYVVLMMTSSSWGIPLLQVAAIQGAIFINFAIPVLQTSNVFFIVYLIVSSIQMGATIDYAIVITGRYEDLNKKVGKKQAVIDSLNEAFPTIITSSSILISSAFLIYFLVSDPLISTLGLALARGTIVSVVSVMCILPLFLYFFYDLLAKTKLPSIDIKQDIKKVGNMIKNGGIIDEKEN